MSYSFAIVEEKLREAAFFLNHLRESRCLSFDAPFYFSAFVSAARSVTHALQKSMKGVDGFDEWYKDTMVRLQTHALARYFKEVRNEVVHEGINPLDRVPLQHLREDLSWQLRGDRPAA